MLNLQFTSFYNWWLSLVLINISWWFCCDFVTFAGGCSNLVFVILDRLTVKSICYISNWFWLVPPTEVGMNNTTENQIFVCFGCNYGRKYLDGILIGWYIHRITSCGLTEKLIVVVSALMKSKVTFSLVNSSCWPRWRKLAKKKFAEQPSWLVFVNVSSSYNSLD